MPVAVTSRSGVDESLHHGVVVGLDQQGDVAFAAGDPELGIYPRSAVKPLQAEALIAAGLDLPPELLALVCASHDGRPEHLTGVRRILAGAGLDDAALDNTPAWPVDDGATDELIRAGSSPSSLLQNCSGKHAGMLATCVINGWPTVGYLDVDHPLQTMIVAHLDAVTGGVSHVGIDGCGAPTPVCSLRGLAAAVRQIALEGGPVYRAMTERPDMVGGPTRDVTRLMRAVPGLMAKEGAEGVYVAALPDGRAVALKIADGANRARVPVMVAALHTLGVEVSDDSLIEAVFGHGRRVGTVRSIVGTP